MSHVLRFASAVNDHAVLSAACDRMRAAGLAVKGPNWVKNHPRAAGDKDTIDGYAVRLPGWRSDAVFACDGTGEMVADNYSDYYDYRRIDPRTGDRLDGTGDVHEAVKAGRKRVGEDGRWGDIKYLDRLNMEYRAVLVERTALEHGGTISYSSVDENAGIMAMTIDIPEPL